MYIKMRPNPNVSKGNVDLYSAYSSVNVFQKLFLFMTLILSGLLTVLIIYISKVHNEKGKENPGCPTYSCRESTPECKYSAYFYDPQQGNKKLCQKNYYYVN